MSGEPDAKRDLAEAILRTADEAWSVVYDWVHERIHPEGLEVEEEEAEVEVECCDSRMGNLRQWVESQLEDLRMRVFSVSEAWNRHMKKHELFDEDQKRMWGDILRIDHMVSQEPPKPPTMIEKLEIQKHDQQINVLFTFRDWAYGEMDRLKKRLEELERKEAVNGIAGSGTHAQQLGIQADDNVQSVRIWCQTSGAGCDSARDWLAKGDGAATCQAGSDPSVEVGGPAAVQPGGGEHVPAADGGDQPAGGG